MVWVGLWFRVDYGFLGVLRCAAEAGNGYAEAVAVFCDCATSDVVAFLVEFSTYEVVAKWTTFVFVFDDLLDGCLYSAC